MLSQEKQKEASLILYFHVPLYRRYVLSLNNSKFCDWVDRIYRIELEIKDDLIRFDLLCLTPLSAISWRPVLVVEEAGVPGENHPLWASNW